MQSSLRRHWAAAFLFALSSLVSLTAQAIPCGQLPDKITSVQFIALDDLLVPIAVPFAPTGQCFKNDFNADGKLDLFIQGQHVNDENFIFLADKNGRYTSIHQRWSNTYLNLKWSFDESIVHVGDFNSDGRADFIVESRVTGGTNSMLYAGTNARFTATAQTWTNSPTSVQESSGSIVIDTTTSNDTNATKGSTGQLETSSCSGFADKLTTITLIPFDDLLIPIATPFKPIGKCIKVDLNGDGKLDFFVQGQHVNDENFIFLADKDGKYTSIHQRWNNDHQGLKWSVDQSRIYVGDFNGDGRADFIVEALADGGTNGLLYTNKQGRVLSIAQKWTNTITPTVSNVPLPTVAGVTAGSFDVDQNGAANYSIPIAVPPGIAGMEPKLALSYSSQGGNGLLGVGWNLSGLSAITRCPRTIDQDGIKGGVNVDSNDRFCLDGQRLMAVVGAYGASGTEYRTEIESFSKVISYGAFGSGPDHFIVKTKAGLTMYYGQNAQSKVEATGPSGAISWAVNRIEDTLGNYLDVTYYKDKYSGEHFPEVISYTGRGALAPTRKVYFQYGGRNDSLTGYISGGSVTTMRVLTNIKTYVRSQLVRDYRISYDSSSVTGRPRITQVQDCTGSACFSPLVFAWQNGTSGFALGNAASPDNYESFSGFFPGTTYTRTNPESGVTITETKARDQVLGDIAFSSPDINGDGRADVCYRDPVAGIVCRLTTVNSTTGAGSIGGPTISTGLCANGDMSNGACNDGDNHRTIRFVDVNADGAADLVYRSDSGVQLRLFNKTTQNFPTNLSSGICANNANGCNGTDSYFSVQFPDINGDGLPDACYRSGADGVVCYLNRVSFATYWDTLNPIKTGICANGAPLCNDADNHPTINYIDINADGMADVVYRGDSGVETWLSNGTGFFNRQTSGICDNTGCNDSDNRFTVQFPDLNGDGLADLCYRSDASGVVCYFNTGSNGATTRWAYAYATGICSNSDIGTGLCGGSNYETIQYADINHDGKSDLLYRGNSGLMTFLAKGNGFSAPTQTDVCKNGTTTYGACDHVDYTLSIRPTDTTGDGKVDLLFLSVGRVNVVKGFSGYPDLLTGVTNGVGCEHICCL